MLLRSSPNACAHRRAGAHAARLVVGPSALPPSCHRHRRAHAQPTARHRVSVAAVRDFDGKYGDTSQSSGSSSSPSSDGAQPSLEELMADLYPEEQHTVTMFQDNSQSVVNVSVTTLRGIFPFNMMQVPRGMGSGFIWDTKGHVITNSHVVSAASKVSITLFGGTIAKAVVVGRDNEKDIAVLKMDLPAEQLAQLVPLKIGSSSNLLVGQKVYALGNPFGLDLSLTQGIVSGLGREIGSPSPMNVPITNVIQTDAAINPGNSGGPLLDSKGRLVGINTAILDPTGAGISSGVGFAVPIDSVKGMVDQILVHGRVIRPAMGVTISPLPIAMGQKQEGVLVINVRPGGPADVAGIQPTRREMFGRISLGDIILAVNGKPIKKQRDLFAALDSCKVGQAVDVKLAPRNEGAWNSQRVQGTSGQERTVRVVLADREKMQWGSE